MNKKLREFLDSFGFTYEFASSTEKYASGAFDDGLRKVMEHYDEISDLFQATIAEDKRAAWSPFFPICENCGRIYSTRVTGYDPRRSPSRTRATSPQRGSTRPAGTRARRASWAESARWAGKWTGPLRWYCLGVDYEMHGEDLLESARLSSRIVKVLGGEPPELFKYELFLDENGKKISKKIGNGVSLEQWLRFAPVDSLLYFMYLKPQQAKRMGLPLLPEIIDGYLELVESWDGSEDSPVPFISRLSRKGHAAKLAGQKTVTYSLILQLILALNQDDPRIVRDYLLKYQPDIAGNVAYYEQLIEDALAYYREVVLPGAEDRGGGPRNGRCACGASRCPCPSQGQRRGPRCGFPPDRGFPGVQGPRIENEGLVSDALPGIPGPVPGAADRKLHFAPGLRENHRATGPAPAESGYGADHGGGEWLKKAET